MCKIIAAAMLSVLFLGCGLEGPAPTDKEKSATNAATPATPGQESNRAGRLPGTVGNAGKPAPPRATVTWSPDPALLSKLAPADLDPVGKFYRMRQPSNWYFASSPGTILPDKTKEYKGIWVQLGPDNEPQCILQMSINEPNPRVGIDHYPFGAMFNVVVTAGKTKLKKEPPEKGNVNGIEFTRNRWSAEENGKKLRGLFYIARFDQRALFFLIQASAGDHDDAIRLAESAVLTLQNP